MRHGRQCSLVVSCRILPPRLPACFSEQSDFNFAGCIGILVTAPEIPAVLKANMVLQWHPPVRLFKSNGVNDRFQSAGNVHFLGDVKEPFPSRFRRFEEVRRFPLSCCSGSGISLRRGGLVCSISSFSFSQIRSATYSAPESVAAHPRETRATGGNDNVQTDEGVQQQRRLNFSKGQEIPKDWESPWEKNVPLKLDGERARAGSFHHHGDEKASELNDPLTKGEQQPQEEDGGVSSTSRSSKYELESEVEERFFEEPFLDVKHGEIRSSSSTQRDTNLDSTTQEIASFEEGLPGKQLRSEALDVNDSQSDGQITTVTLERSASLNLEREMEVAVCAVQLACLLSQRTQHRVLHQEEKADQKKDRSLVTVADWGVQAVVSWVLSQGFEGEEIPMIAEEDTTGLRGMEKIDLLQRVVDAVNQCLQEAEVVGICPPAHPLGAMDVLKAIGKGSAEGGKKGRYWVLDPVDGTLGFVRGDQYAIALALLEDGEVILAILGCPNFPLRKQWLRYHHRYYRLAAKLRPPSPGKWHKGMVLTTTRGAGQVMMRPLVVDADGSPKVHGERQTPQRISVSRIDDPAKATFCEPSEKANSSHSFTAGLAQSLGLRNRPLRVYSLAKYAAIARGDAEIFMKFAKSGYKEKIWDHAAGVLIVQEAGGVVTDAAGRPLDFSQGRLLRGLDRGIIACSGRTLHEQLLKAVDASWDSSTL